MIHIHRHRTNSRSAPLSYRRLTAGGVTGLAAALCEILAGPVLGSVVDPAALGVERWVIALAVVLAKSMTIAAGLPAVARALANVRSPNPRAPRLRRGKRSSKQLDGRRADRSTQTFAPLDSWEEG